MGREELEVEWEKKLEVEWEEKLQMEGGERSWLIGAGGRGPAQVQYRSYTAGGTPGAVPQPLGSQCIRCEREIFSFLSHLRGRTLKRETPCVRCELQLI